MRRLGLLRGDSNEEGPALTGPSGRCRPATPCEPEPKNPRNTGGCTPGAVAIPSRGYHFGIPSRTPLA